MCKGEGLNQCSPVSFLFAFNSQPLHILRHLELIILDFFTSTCNRLNLTTLSANEPDSNRGSAPRNAPIYQ